jgi:metal-responsive CopG/Arc/MetJ family transcriptional regulator
MYMKSIQITFDERLLKKLDSDEEVKRDGRSAVLRRAAAEYLRRKRKKRIAEGYRRAYGKDGTLGSEFAGWSDEGSWRDE